MKDLRLNAISLSCLWLFAAVSLLSIAAQNILFVGLAAWLLAQWQDGRRLSLPGPLAWFLPFLILALLACLNSENLAHSLDTYKRWLLFSAAWYAALAINDSRDLNAILGALLFFSALWCLGAALLALMSGPAFALYSGRGLKWTLRLWAEKGEWRAHSGSGGYMVLGTGSMLLCCLYTGLALNDARYRRPLALASLAALALALLLTLTRSAWLGAAAGCGLLLVFRRPGLAVLAAVVVLLLVILPGSPVGARFRQGITFSDDSTRERVYMAQSGMMMIREHPWLGVGDAMESFDGKPGYYRRYLSEAAAKIPSLRDEEHGHLHNDLIQVAAMYGIPALLMLIWFFGRLVMQLWPAAGSSGFERGLAEGVLASLLAWWVNGQLEYNFGSFQSCFLLWFLIGLGLAGRRLGRHESVA